MRFTDAKKLQYGDVLEHKKLKNADGSPVRARVNGKVKLWKTQPNRLQVPLKYGLRECFYLTEDNYLDWVKS